MKISAIIPVYNSAKYLRPCLDSVLAQSFRDFEVICVDNGSVDATPEILANYAKYDARVRVITTERSNGGKARNVGMQVAAGAYLSFLDSDDFISPYFFETLLTGAEKANAEIACCGAIQFVHGENAPHFERPNHVAWHDTTKNSAENAYFCKESYYPWDKLYKRSLIDRYDFKFVEQTSSNDITFICCAVSHAQKMIITSEPLYAYRRHNSSTQALKSKSPECYFNAITATLDIFMRTGILQVRPWLLDSLKVMTLLGGFNQLNSQTTREGYEKTYRGFIELDAMMELSNLGNRRYRRMVNGIWHERLRGVVESHLAFYLGTFSTASPRKKRCISFLQGLLKLLFDPVSTGCAIVQRHKRVFRSSKMQ